MFFNPRNFSVVSNNISRSEKMKKRLFALFLIVFISFLFFPAYKTVFAQEEVPSVDTIIKRIKENGDKVKDMSADVETTITSSLKESKPIIQIGKIWTKSPDKSKVEIYSPIKQITITDGDIMTIISPDTGMKFTQDLSKSKEKGALPQVSSHTDTTKIFEYFDLKLTQHGTKELIISGTPKEKNEFLGKIDFFVDNEIYLPFRIVIYNPEGILISLSELNYKKFDDAWVPEKTTSIVSVPGGSMNIDMKLKNIKINKGISDEEFKVD